MLFTIYHAREYSEDLAKNPNLFKKKGDSVWKTFEEAKKYAGAGDCYLVLGVEADWIKDTTYAKSNLVNFKRLTRDCKIVKI